MIPFPTTKAELIKLEFILEKLKLEKFDKDFIFDCKAIASDDQGVFDLLNLWFEGTDINENNECINDIRQILHETLYDW